MMQPEPKQYAQPEAWAINGQSPPPDVWHRILQWHIRPVVSIYYAHGIPLVPSRGSCYRPKEWEEAKGRSGWSLHTFPGRSRGACDLVRADGLEIITALDLLVEEGPWRRICLYPSDQFIHVDYGDQAGAPCARRQLFECAGGREPWQFRSWLAEVPALPRS